MPRLTSADSASAALRRLTEGAAGDANLLQLSVEAARARATAGAISEAMYLVMISDRRVSNAERDVLRGALRVLDACAAPGGKTAHLLEIADLDLVALEGDLVEERAVAARAAGRAERASRRQGEDDGARRTSPRVSSSPTRARRSTS